MRPRRTRAVRPRRTWRPCCPPWRQAIAKHLELLTDAGLVLAEPGERRRIRYRVNAAPMTVAQAYLAALARDWDSSLSRLQRVLDERA